MNIKNIKKNVAVIMLCSFMVVSVPAETFAHSGPESECICTDKCTEENINKDCPVCSKDYTLCQGQEAETEETKETEPQETMGPLTPDGNMTLVDDYGNPDKAGKQFITITSKNGNYFYIIIDRDDNGNESVHFLNMVDESDLLKLMDDDEKKAYENELAEKEAEEQSKLKETVPETEAEPVEKTEESRDKGFQSPNPLVLLLVLISVLGGIGLYLYKKINIKKPVRTKQDPDIDYREGDKDEDYIETLNAEDATDHYEDLKDSDL